MSGRIKKRAWDWVTFRRKTKKQSPSYTIRNNSNIHTHIYMHQKLDHDRVRERRKGTPPERTCSNAAPLILSIHSDIMIFRILFTLGFVLAIDLYAYQAFKTVFRSTATPWIYWGITLAYIVLSVSISVLKPIHQNLLSLNQ